MPQNTDNAKVIKVPNEILLPEIIRLTDEGHTVTLRVDGVSMRPFVEGGRDKALLTRSVNPQIGDAVLAEIFPGHYVLHRLVSVKNGMATLRGDGNLGTEHCRMKDIKCKALGFYRKGRENLDSTSGLKWKVYSWWWTRLLPVRRYLLFIYRHLFVS
jgi:hypothetical protein